MGAFGPVVERGSLLESLTKIFRAPILLDEATANLDLATEGIVERIQKLNKQLARALNEMRWALYGRIEQHIRRRVGLVVFRHLHDLSWGRDPRRVSPEQVTLEAAYVALYGGAGAEVDT